MRPRMLLEVSVFLLALLLPAAAQAQGFHAVYSRDGVDVWAVGDAGVVYRSFDRGSNWTSRTLGGTALRGVAARGFNVVVVGDSGKIWRSQDSGGGWLLTVAGGAPDLRGLDMPSDGVCYAVGAGGTILKTMDGGGTWSVQPSGTIENLNAVRFTDELHGWAVGDHGTVLRTEDGGTWRRVMTGAVQTLWSVDQRGGTVWVVGGKGTALRSGDGGTSWGPVRLKLDARSEVRAVWLEAPNTVYLGGGGGFVRRSTDGGGTWEFLRHELQAQISDLYFSGVRGWAVSDKKRILMSTADGGTTWSLPTGATVARSWEHKLPTGAAVRGSTLGMDGAHENTLYCALGNTVWRSRDEGEIWDAIGTIPQCDRVNAFIVSPKDTNSMVAAVAAVGVPDRLVKSDDQGQTWFTTLIHDFGIYGIPLEMDPDHPDTMYFGGESDGIYRSTDGGKNWTLWSTSTFRSPCDIVVVPDSANILLVGDGVTGFPPGEYYKSTNGGQSFTLTLTIPSGSEIPGLACSRLRNSTAFGTNWGSGGVQRSTDYGTTWPNVHAAGSAWGVDISRDDPNCMIFGVYAGGLSYLSLDGGSTFITTPLVASNYSFFARDRGLILAEQSNGIHKMNVTYAYTPNNTQAVAVTAPNGGEVWAADQVRNITWSAQNIAVARIEYRPSPGEGWRHVADVPGYLATYAWTVPKDATSSAKVRVMDLWDGAPSDTSNAGFTITTAPLLTATPDPLDFLAVPVGTTWGQTLYLQNPGTGAVSIGSITSDDPRFWPGRSSLVIPAHGSDTVGVWYRPLGVGNDTGHLTLLSDDPGSPHTVTLTGQATPSTGVGGEPTAFALWQNEPNPFQGTTLIRYALPTAARVSLEVFDVRGQRVATLVRREEGAGVHAVTFDPGAERAGALSPGVYFYRFRAGLFASTRRMLVLR